MSKAPTEMSVVPTVLTPASLPLAGSRGVPAPTNRVDASAVSSLYVHIPFCERKCGYCDFASVSGMGGHERYLNALVREIHMMGSVAGGVTLSTIFFGGGTPSFVPPRELALVMEAIGTSFDIAPSAEITLEANPSSTSLSRAQEWRASGFNRVSVGVQSLHERGLQFLGRVHSAQGARDAFCAVRNAGFERINCDLIYAVPTMTREEEMQCVDEVLQWDPGHISLYELTVEEGTPLHGWARRHRDCLPSDDDALVRHWDSIERAQRAGYAMYEVSNAARLGHECRHNLVYWRNEPYLAVGVGAHGHVPREAASIVGAPDHSGVAARYGHVRGVGAYCSLLEEGRLPLSFVETIDEHAASEERLMCGLRLHEGVPVANGASRDRLVEAALLEPSHAGWRVTREGQNVLNSVIAELVSDIPPS